jgi:hypothetical protein
MRCQFLRQIAIVGDKENSAWVVRKRGFKSFSRGDIQMICRFVQSQNGWSLVNDLGERNT